MRLQHLVPATILIFLLSATVHAQTGKINYEREWKKVDSLYQLKGLTRSALAGADKIYAAAKQEKNEVQIVKALVYKVALQENIEENGLEKAIGILEKEVASAPSEISRALLRNILASAYWNYFERHRWQLYDRTQTKNFQKDDIGTWGVDDFHSTISSLFLASLQPEALLQQTKLEPYDPLIIKGNSRYLRPTLFDLLAHEALAYLSSSETYVTRPAYVFEIDDPAAFANAADFIQHRFITRDSTSLHFKALQLYQRVLSFHFKDAKPAALIDADIHRLQFVNMYGAMEGKDSLYRAALRSLAQRYPTEKEVDQAWYLLAASHVAKARGYDPLRDTTGRFEYIAARKICESVIARKDSSAGKANCENLLEDILRQEMGFMVEKVNVPAQPFRMLVNYRNFTQLHFRLVAVDRNTRENNVRYGDDYWEHMLKLPVIKSFQQSLPATNDHQRHSVEIKIDALPVGEYALIGSTDKNFSLKTEPMALQFFFVSNIAYINTGYDFFVLHRETGKPLQNAAVQIWNTSYDGKTKTSYQVTITDKNGFFRFRERGKDDHGVLQIEITTANDRLYLPDQAEYYRYHRPAIDEEIRTKTTYEQVNQVTYLFTDRSIYRPGQIVYFKGILITKDYTTRQAKIVPGLKTWVRLYNNQGNQVDSVRVTTNEYGSYSGKFKLPTTLLTGSFRIQDDETDGQVEISIEEYKRPKFYVEYEKPKGTYRVNDTIEVTGFAKAYAGNNIDGAKVKYNVQRVARFPYPWLFWKWGWPRVEEQQIAQGEITTGADGKFSLRFRAIPDKKINKDFAPVFDYQVTVDVTDINGETRSATTTVSVSYKALQLSVDVPGGPMLRADSLKKLSIRTEKLAREFQPARVNVTIYRLNAPQRLIRPRYWMQADQFVMSKEEYHRYFPYDEYSDETKKESWERLEKVYERADSTNAGGSFELKPTNGAAPAFRAGWYAIEVTTSDKFGEPVKDIEYVQLLDPASGLPATPAYRWELSDIRAYQPGETAIVETGTSANDVFLVQYVDKSLLLPPGKRKAADDRPADMKYNFVTLNNEKKTFSFPVTEEDRGGFGVTYAFVKHNRFFSSASHVPVPWTNKELNISYETFRDKTLPGSEEKWTVKLTGSKNEKVSAELLTAMYDASLDQFKPQAWSKPNIWPVYSFGNPWGGNVNFSMIESMERYIPEKYRFAAIIQYDRLLKHMHQLLSRTATVARREMRTSDRDVMGAYSPAPAAANMSMKLEEGADAGYGTPKQDDNISLRGVASMGNNILIIVDGEIYEGSINSINPDDIESIQVLKGAEATTRYGSRGANGVVIITTKAGAKKPEPLQVRKNFNETAFFFPDLKTDSAGNVQFSFTMPEALTQWKWMLLGHTKDLSMVYSQQSIITQKELMVQPNIPRFLREGDRMDLSAKIANMGAKEVSGQIELQLIDATTNQPVDGWFHNMFPNQYFTAGAGQSTVANFTIQIPFQYNKPLIIRYIARAGNVSDGEENSIPVLSNRLLVTETLPLNIRGGGSKNFTFEKLSKSGNSETLSHHAVTVEFTSNPAWYAVQALPYLMEYPYECAEQIWNRVYANALAASIVNASPRIQEIFKKWNTTDTAALLSNLQKNEELKNILLEETPWVLQAKNESEQKKRIALLFDMVKLSAELEKNLDKLMQLQLSNGAFPWFKGGRDDRYITQYIVTGIGHLKKLNAIPAALQPKINTIVRTALPYLDSKIKDDYDKLVAYKADLTKQQIGHIQVNYLYMRSFFNDINAAGSVSKPFTFYRKQAQQFWLQQGRYMQGMIALALFRTGDGKTATDILRSLKQNAIISDEL
ncbi:MAG TPA: alpha-2-macroglobulin family protein, partial [Chitinophagaceae bacterium]|nr:alpha-2-macroglobulin family protein [Chitinophagaceae bacterium]